MVLFDIITSKQKQLSEKSWHLRIKKFMFESKSRIFFSSRVHLENPRLARAFVYSTRVIHIVSLMLALLSCMLVNIFPELFKLLWLGIFDTICSYQIPVPISTGFILVT
jgi:hypothetical protein